MGVSIATEASVLAAMISKRSFSEKAFLAHDAIVANIRSRSSNLCKIQMEQWESMAGGL